MINSLDAYADEGRKAGAARNAGDEARADFHSRWMREALRLEAADDRPAARRAFDDAYKAERAKRYPGSI